MKHTTINISALEKRAKESDAGESFVIYESKKQFKIRSGVKITKKHSIEYVVEATINFCNPDQPFEIPIMEKKIELLKEFKRLGYVISCQEENNFICEKKVTQNVLLNELEQLKQCINNSLGGF